MDAHDNPAKPESHFEEVATKSKANPEHVKYAAFHMMSELEGWCPFEKGCFLIDLVIRSMPDVIVEIGVFGGKSVVPMACALKANGKGIIYGIDPWDNKASIEGVMHDGNKEWWYQLDHERILLGLAERISRFELEDQIELIRSTSAAAPIIPNIDILHIDGNHSEVTSYIDVTKWVPHVKSGGWIIFDDMSWYENGVYTTTKAVEWLNANCIKFAEFSDTCIWGVWVKK